MRFFFFLNFLKNFTFEKGKGEWVYLFTIYFLNFFLTIYILLSHFLPPERGRVAWVLFFSLFVIFCIVC
jgi:hypothetical protein